jgi:hypothetical protein
MNLSKLFLSFNLLISLLLNGFSQNSDSIILQLFADQNLFQLNQEYPFLKENASKEIQLWTEAHLYCFFNKPEMSNQRIQGLLSSDVDWLDTDIQIALMSLMADNSLKMQDYKQTASIYKQLIDQLKGSVDDDFLIAFEGRYKIYSALQDVPPMEVTYTKKREKIPIKQDKTGLLTLPVTSSSNAAILDFILDFGAGFCMIEEKYSDNFAIKILSDSITAISGTTTMKIGVAEEINIGKINLKNVVFLISSNKIIEGIPDYEIKGLIGFPVMKALENLTVSKKSLKIFQSKINPKIISNMMIHNNAQFIQANAAHIPLCFQFDNGTVESYLTQQYLFKTMEENQYLPLDTVRQVSYAGSQTFRILKKKDFSCQIGSKQVIFPLINIHIDDVNLTNLPIDGVIGKDIILRNKYIHFDFKNMYFYLK